MYNSTTLFRSTLLRSMSILAQLPKTSSLPASLTPDNVIKSEQVATENDKNVIRTPRILHDGAFSWTLPEVRKEYKYVTSSDRALHDLGLDPRQVSSEEYQKIVSGQVYHESFREKYPFPYSQAYAGWQFGQFAGQLGDGRVHTLFEVDKPQKSPFNRAKYELQLKGSGKTPYSRFADGKAVVRSSIREYIISEHLNAIGIPTTRALSLTYLPQTYAQRSAAEKCAIVSRFAELWIRLGTFDLYRWRFDAVGIRRLSDYVINELFTVENGQFPYLTQTLSDKSGFFDESKNSVGKLTDYDKMYLEIIVRNAASAAMWQAYGFLNGVLNTDNTSVLGLAMDFGPFSIMDKFDPDYTPNSEDHQGRYSYSNTPTAIWWNLTRLGEDLAQLIGAGTEMINDQDLGGANSQPGWEEKVVKRASKVIEIGGEMYRYAFTKKYVETFFNRLGLLHKLIDSQDPDRQNTELLVPMLDMLRKVQCDYNKFFLSLQEANVEAADFDASQFAQSILLKDVSKHEEYNREEITQTIVEWVQIYQGYILKSGGKRGTSSKFNPVFLPRNWILDEVTAYTQESGFEDLSYLKKLEKMSFYPYDSTKWGDDLKELEKKWLLQSDRGDEYSMLQCSCSS